MSKARKIKLPDYCVSIGTSLNEEDKTCDHDFEEDEFHNERSDECRHWRCTKCNYKKCYEIGG